MEQVSNIVSNLNPILVNNYIFAVNDKLILVEASIRPNQFFEKYNRYPDYIFITHAHFDHVFYLKEWLDISDKIFITSKQFEVLSNPNYSLVGFFKENIEIFANKNNFNIYDLGKPYKIEDIIEGVKVFSTPGHSFDSVCFKIDNYLVVGDTVFPDSIGRTDLPTSNEDLMFETLKFLKSFFKQNPNLIILSGHANKIRAGKILQFNPFFINL